MSNPGLYDVFPSDMNVATVARAIGKGIVPTGIQTNYTAPITRLEFAQMAVLFIEYFSGQSIDAFMLANTITPRAAGSFRDTNDPAALAALALGITNGTGSSHFSPDLEITREQAATMLQRLWTVTGLPIANNVPSEIDDLDDASAWAVESINFIRGNAIMADAAEGSFNPLGSFTREQAVVTFDRIW
ncbi:MAG: S-layer homology domain-containing protein [Oscillospiraceae bacterium]|nr:S-layer homology domain-containing protein [Oscillospiraceae bacterium]